MNIFVALHLPFVACSLVVALVGTSFGEQWTSPDGVVSVSAPDSDDFTRMDDPPRPFLALWVSNDKSLYLGVIKDEVPPGELLSRSSVEQELDDETNGEITQSKPVVSNGQELWVVTADSSAHGSNLRITQAVTQIGVYAYKAYAASVGSETPGHASVDTNAPDYAPLDAFVNSFEIKLPGPAIVRRPVTEAEPAPEAGLDSHLVSKWAGGAALLLLIGLAAWRFAEAKKTAT